jgi:DegV family protein with EDD domain
MKKEAKKIAIVTDSVADIPDSLIKEYNIKVVPLYISFDGNSYKENIEIGPDRIYEELQSGQTLKTSTPTVNDFIEVYKDLKKNEDPDIIYSIHLSLILSGTINSAIAASKSLEGVNIKVIDSKKAAISEGFIVLSAAHAVRSGAAEEEIDKLVERMIASSYFYATFDNFEYVLKGGRTPFLAKFIGKTMVLKPIITFSPAGKLKLKNFCLNSRSSIKQLYTLIKSDIISSDMGRCRIGICYGNDAGPAERLKGFIEDDPGIDVDDFVMTKMTSVMAAHTGPGIWGIAACPAYEKR